MYINTNNYDQCAFVHEQNGFAEISKNLSRCISEIILLHYHTYIK